MFPDMGRPQTTTIPLAPGDTVVLVTDGILEARSGEEQFGADRVAEIVRANVNRSAGEIVAALYRAVSSFSNSETQADDMTAIVIKATDVTSRPAAAS
jgi:serine phosphatase RsbU (regulator of sigma subunit)